MPFLQQNIPFFYKKNNNIFRFSLIKEHLIEFNQLAMANSEGSDNMLNRVMPKDNIGLAALLKTKEAAWENGRLTIWYLNWIAPFNFNINKRQIGCQLY